MADEGISYFPLYCALDEKFELVEAEFGLKGFAIVVKLFQRIYGGHGYYCEWSDDISLIFAKQCGFSSVGGKGLLDCAGQPSQSGRPQNLVDLVVAASIRRGIFDKQLFENFSVLTSKGIQRTFLNTVRKRKKVEIKKEYLLLSDAEIRENVVITGESSGRNAESSGRLEQRKVKESKGKYSTNTMCKAEADALFDELWERYPVKKGKGRVSSAAKQRLLKVGRDEMIRAIDRYLAELEKDSDWRKPQNGSTFFNSGYIDYLDDNFVPGEAKRQKQTKNQFNSFPQRERTREEYSEIEKALLRGGQTRT